MISWKEKRKDRCLIKLMRKNMNIWEILQIEVTTDKKTIKKAYAQRSKSIHPEEKPEEFQQLYQAYQMALDFAKDGSAKEIRNASEPSHTAGETGKETEDTRELKFFFAEKQEYKKVCMEAFSQLWESHCRRYVLSNHNEEWQEFMESEEFKEIQMDMWVIGQIVIGVQKMTYYPDEDRLNLWECYHFQEKEKSQYQGELSQLYHLLYPAVLRQRQKQEEERKKHEEQLVQELRIRFIKRAAVIAAVFLCVTAPIYAYFKITAERRYIVTYMSKKYPGIVFTEPEEQKDEAEKGQKVFCFQPSEQPGLTIRAQVKKNHWNTGDEPFDVAEDYGVQIVQRYAESYGLKCSCESGGFFVFYYSNIDEISQFSESFSQFLEKERVNIRPIIGSVGFRQENILFPQIMLEGVEGEWDSLVYAFDKIPKQQELADLLLKSCITYMYHYEAWNLTPEQQAQYGPEYVAEGQQREEQVDQTSSFGRWGAVDDVKDVEDSYNLYIPLKETAVYKNNIKFSSNYIYCITVGNAYQYLKARGLEMEVSLDGSGFSVIAGGEKYDFGEKAEVILNEVYSLVTSEGLEKPSNF